MSQKITAEFSQIDQAENAARALRQQIPDIKNIVLKSRNGEEYIGSPDLVNISIPTIQNGYDLFYAPFSQPYTYAGTFVPITSHKEVNNEMNLKQEAWLEVACDEHHGSAVSSILRNFGGTKIKTIV